MTLGSLIRFMRHPRLGLFAFVVRFPKLFSDELYIKICYRMYMGEKLNLKHPVKFTEKLQWLKLYNRKSLYTRMADKYEVKEYVAGLVGNEYVVDNYGVWDTVEEIDISKLPNQFVMKCTADSGGVFICRDKNSIRKRDLYDFFNKGINKNFYYQSREWVYKNIHPRIIVDKFLDDDSGHELIDYKFMCFNGVPKLMYITNKGKDIFENFYDMDFNPLDISHGFRRDQPEFEKPSCFELMRSIAEKLSKGIPFVRVDFFYVKEHVYFGEFTFYDWGGMKPFTETKWDYVLGEMLTLPQ